MSNKKPKYFSGLSRSTFLLALTSLFADISTEMLYPILPVFLTETLGANGSVVGLVEGVAVTTQNIVQGFSGWLSDKFQKRKTIAIVGYSLAALSKTMIGFAVVWPQVLGARFLDRVGTGIRSAPRDALVAASADNQNRGRAFGLEGFGDNLGAFIGPIIAVILLFLLHIDMRNIFYLAIIPGILAVAMMSLVKEKPLKIESKARIDLNFKNFTTKYWKYLMVTIIFGIGNSSNLFLILQVKDIGVPLAITILIYAAFNLVAALISYPSGALSDKFGRKYILLLSFLIFFITYIGFAYTKNVFVIGALFCFYGLYQGIFRSVGKALAADLVPEKLRASGIGWFSTAVGLSGFIASLVGGQLWDNSGHESVFLYGAFTAIAGALALLFLVRGGENKLLIRE